MSVLAERVDELLEIMGPPPTENAVLVVAINCNGCGHVQNVPPPYNDPQGWIFGPFGADADYCARCNQ